MYFRSSPRRAEAIALHAQQRGKLPFEAQYEPRCYLTGEVQTRANNWHDLFNALVWLTFPKTKAVLNARHYHALTVEEIASGSHRGAVRDVNTLLDESGVIVVYADANSDIDWPGCCTTSSGRNCSGAGANS